MTPPTFINIVVEDALSESVARKILNTCNNNFSIGYCYSKNGYGYIKRTINGFNNAAKSIPYLVITDLDRIECPPLLIQEWLKRPRHHNLIFRVAVREVETWLLAHREAMAKFLGISVIKIPTFVESIENPKEFLVNLARMSKNRKIRADIVPVIGSTAKVGRNYNGSLMRYVENNWLIDKAIENSQSLKRTIDVISNFKPIFSSKT